MPWVKASECEHWSMTCPRAKKAKKAHHKLKQSPSGFLVDVTGIAEGWPSYDWQYDHDPPESAFELSTKRFLGHWCPGRAYLFHDRCGVGYEAMDMVDEAGNGGVWVPAPQGLLIECALECGFKAAV